METAQSKILARRFREALDRSKGTTGEIDAYVAPDSVWNMPGGPPLGREQATGMSAMFYSAFPDMHHTFDDQIAEGDRVVSRVTFRGTHRGDFQGVPATGNTVAFGAIFIDRLRDGKIVEHWAQFDMMGLMQQLGAVPEPA